MHKRLNILHLEDNDFDGELLVEELIKENIFADVTQIKNKNSFLEALERNTYDLVLCDNTLPDFNGIDALRHVKKVKPHLPFIFVSGTLSEDIAIEAMKWGASDYILKQKMSKLGITITRVLKEFQQKYELEKAIGQLRENEAILRVAVSSAEIFVFSQNINLIYTWVYEPPFELRPDFLIGKSDKDVFLPEDAIALRNLKQSVIVSKEIKRAELEILYNNRKYYFYFVISPLVDSSGAVVGVIGAQHDITDRKSIEKKIRESNERLEELNRLKSSFLSNMSHELRTPMIAILGFAEILSTETDNIENKKLIDGILIGANRLHSTLNSILELSQIESSSKEIKVSTQDIVSLVRNSFLTYSPMVEQKGLTFNFSHSSGVLLTELEPELFVSALNRILENAIKFTESGGIKINISTIEDETSNVAHISISDTGIGISKSNQNDIFGSFRQDSEGFNRNYEGVGIGLTIAQKSIQLLNGKISIQSEEGKGSTFLIELPMKLSHSEISKAVQRKITTEFDKQPEIESKIKHLLVVEDNQLTVQLIKRFLKDEFYVFEAKDGISALAAASKINFPLILMDINLGAGINGTETMLELRKSKRYEKIPIIAVTAYALSGDRERFIKYGFTDYLGKPFNKNQLIDIIRKNIDEFVRTIA